MHVLDSPPQHGARSLEEEGSFHHNRLGHFYQRPRVYHVIAGRHHVTNLCSLFRGEVSHLSDLSLGVVHLSDLFGNLVLCILLWVMDGRILHVRAVWRTHPCAVLGLHPRGQGIWNILHALLVCLVHNPPVQVDL